MALPFDRMDHERMEAGAPSPQRPLVAAAIGAFALVLIGLLSLGSDLARRADDAALGSFRSLGDNARIADLAHQTGHFADPLPVAVMTVVLLLVALVRRRPRTALAVVLVVLGANLTTQILKPALAAPWLASMLGSTDAPTGSWPSGHSTGAMSLALCAVLVAAPRWRPVVATLGAAFAVAVGYSLLVLGAHVPSDVLGGYLVAAVWALGGAATVRAADRRWPPRSGRAVVVRLHHAVTPALAAAVAALVAAGAVIVMRPETVLVESVRHTSAVAAGLAVAAVGLSVATALVLALRR